MSHEFGIPILPHIKEIGLQTFKVPRQDLPPLKISLLSDVVREYSLANLESFFETRESLITVIGLIQQLFQCLPTDIETYKSLQVFVPKLFGKPVLVNDLNKLILSFFISLSSVFKLYITPQSETLSDIFITTTVMYKELANLAAASGLEEANYKYLFNIAAGLLDYVVVHDNVSIKDNIKEQIISNLMDILLVISLQHDDFWLDTKNIWTQWNKNLLFLKCLCSQMKEIIKAYMGFTFIKNNPPSTNFAFCLNALTRILDISKIPQNIISQFANPFTEVVTDLNNQITELAQTKLEIFFARFPVSIIAAYFIDRGLDVLGSYSPPSLINEIMKLIALCGYTKDTYPFIENSILVLNQVIQNFVKQSTVNTSDKIQILSSPYFVPYMAVSSSALCVSHSFMDAFSDYPTVQKIYDFLTNLVSISSTPHFKFSSKNINVLWDNAKAKSEMNAILPALHLLYTTGTDDDCPEIFNSIFDEISKLPDQTLSATLTLLASLPYSNSIERAKRFFVQPKLRALVEGCPRSKSVTPLLLLALIEISAFSDSLITGLQKNKEVFEKYPELLYLLSQARLKKLKYEVKNTFTQSTDTFFIDDKLFTVAGADNNHYNLIIRDAGGVSLISLDEILTDTDKKPTLVQLPEGKAPTTPQNQQVQIEVMNSPMFIPSDDIPAPKAARSLQMKPFGEVPRNPGRPPVFDVIRLLDLYTRPELKIVSRSAKANIDKLIDELDNVPAVPTIDVPVYYVDQNSKKIDFVENQTLINFLSAFTKVDNNNGKTRYMLPTNTVRFNFTMKKVDSPMCIVFNNSVMDLKAETFEPLENKVILSIQPLGGSHFKISLEVCSIDTPMSIRVEIPQIVHIRHMGFFLIYYGQLSLSVNCDIFGQQVKKRKEIIKKITEGLVSPLDFLCELQM